MTDNAFEGLFEKLERVRLDFTSLVNELSDIPFASSASGSAGGWSEPLSTWWARERAGADREVASLYAKLVDHGRVLFSLAERLGTPAGGSSGDDADLMAILERFQRTMAECLGATPGGDMLSPMSQLVDNWQRHAATVFGLPASPASAFPDLFRARGEADLKTSLAPLLDPASDAASRLHGESLQEMVEAVIAYQDTFNRFARLTVEATGDAVERMKDALSNRADDEAFGVREFYDLWLDSCEQSYDDLARDDRFAELMGALVNDAVRVHRARQRLTDAAATTLGLPSRRQFRELAAALHESRRRLSRLERGTVERFAGSPLADETMMTTPVPEPRVDSEASTATSATVMAPGAPARRKSAAKKVARKKVANKPASKKKTAKRSASKKKTVRKKASAGKASNGKPSAALKR